MKDPPAFESKPEFTCPHSYGKGATICWDCAEGGHFNQGGGNPPISESYIMSKNGFNPINGSNSPASSTFAGSHFSAPEVYPPPDGLELSPHDPRKNQPGLEVLTGPRITGPEDIYYKVEGRNWDTKQEKEAIATRSPPPTILRLRKRAFWLVLICILVALLVGAGIGAAVGVTRKNNSTKASVPATSPSASSDNQVSGSFLPSPSMATETVSILRTDAPGAMTTDSVIASVLSSDLNTVGGAVETESSLSTVTISSTDEGGHSVEKVTVTLVQTQSVSTTNPIQSAASPTTPTATTAPASKTSTGPAATHTSASSKGKCLAEDGSTYTDPGTGSQFKIECDVAHQGKDIDNYEASSMEECISMCTKNTECVGVIWYSAGPQGTDLNYCWLKSTMDDDLKSTKDAQSAVLL
ncbi:uncharacterized protein F4822DRAFT_414964 [Hypoxylon trugodes]|uniref:uncharacterized protein n=1 Tax=Hypoxylon trugodes TaxID=326681 RepID=UPI00219980C5|nr:uncharacterized protein F4822DRAFT_414964 [Hypoxylon trugodes]KAI1384384.1 hypothetical protein F4822DRAFT_414964 [Hypoxylon trugodes]